MKNLKKAVALLLAVVFILSLTACHKKDEIAVWSGDYKLTSAMYSYFLVMADSEAKSLISSSEDYDTKAAGFSYYKQEIKGKSFETYVKDLAMGKCLRYLVLEKLFKEADLKLDDETKEGWQSTAQYYWAYSYGAVLQENGVAYETYEKIMLNDALYNLYFEHLYGEGGEKAVSQDSVKTALTENYSAVYMITHDYSEEEKPDVDAISKNLDKYVAELKDGKEFADVLATYNKDNGVKEEADNNASSSSGSSSKVDSSADTSSTDSSKDASSNTTSSDDKKEEEKKPVDENITILTDYEETHSGEAVFFTKYNEVEKLRNGDVALIHDEDAKCYYIVVKKNISTDPYYLESLDGEIRYLLKSEEFDTMLKDAAAALDYEVSSFAINQFKVKKIYDGSEEA